jgi:hypothetical protein
VGLPEIERRLEGSWGLNVAGAAEDVEISFKQRWQTS